MVIADLKKEPAKSRLIYKGNQSAIIMAKNPQFHGQAKHIAITYHYVREQASSGRVELRYCKTDDMITDIKA